MTPAELVASQRKRKDRAARTKYGSLVTTPGAGSVTLPAGARLAIRNTSVLADNTAALSIGDRTINVGAGVAGRTTVLDWLPGGSVVNIESGFDLLLDMGNGVYKKIGSG